MASGQGKDNTPAGQLDRAKMMRVLVPALAVGAIVILVAVITGISDGSSHKMSDGSNGTIDDPDLKDVSQGVKYRDLKEGSGEACPAGANVKVNYTGWLPDGTVFDSSKDKDRLPLEANLNGDLIQGWKDGIPGMKPGGIRKLVIAPEKAYGNRNKGKIPANSTLIFEIELLSFSTQQKLPEGDGKLTEGAGRPMSDDSNGGTNDPELKDIGEGLKIRDLKEGSGDPVRPLASITANYTGWLTDGTVFDSSKKQKGGGPSNFSLSRVVRGWQMGIPGMKPGGIRKIVVPAALGYGSKKMGDIPPNSTLIFEVELVK